MEKDWVKVGTYQDEIKAEMDRQMLEESSIKAILLNKQDSSFKFGRVELYVDLASEEEALALLVQTSGQSEEG